MRVEFTASQLRQELREHRQKPKDLQAKLAETPVKGKDLKETNRLRVRKQTLRNQILVQRLIVGYARDAWMDLEAPERVIVDTGANE